MDQNVITKIKQELMQDLLLLFLITPLFLKISVYQTKEMNDEEAAFYGCAVLTGGGIIINEMRPKKDNTVAIIGIGGVGYVALKFYKVSVKKIVCIDNNSKKIKYY